MSTQPPADPNITQPLIDAMKETFYARAQTYRDKQNPQAIAAETEARGLRATAEITAGEVRAIARFLQANDPIRICDWIQRGEDYLGKP